MKHLIYSLLIIIVVLLTACGLSKVFTKQQILYIRFGGVGGYMNQNVSYVIDSKGQLLSNGQVLLTIPKDTLQSYYKQVKELGEPFSHSGPNTCYLEIETNQGIRHYSWVLNDSIDADLKDLYHKLLSNIP
ncbi:hypothetical protein N9251_02640 [Gammaproteobacteria bacterium]|nr:hypothetical protein [Gammaproteobacteria bacterium]